MYFLPSTQPTGKMCILFNNRAITMLSQNIYNLTNSKTPSPFQAKGVKRPNESILKHYLSFF
jgi:hypothetical protein